MYSIKALAQRVAVSVCRCIANEASEIDRSVNGLFTSGDRPLEEQNASADRNWG